MICKELVTCPGYTPVPLTVSAGTSSAPRDLDKNKRLWKIND